MSETPQNPSAGAGVNAASASGEPATSQVQEQQSATPTAAESASGHTATEAIRVGRKSSASEARR